MNVARDHVASAGLARAPGERTMCSTVGHIAERRMHRRNTATIRIVLQHQKAGRFAIFASPCDAPSGMRRPGILEVRQHERKRAPRAIRRQRGGASLLRRHPKRIGSKTRTPARPDSSGLDSTGCRNRQVLPRDERLLNRGARDVSIDVRRLSKDAPAPTRAGSSLRSGRTAVRDRSGGEPFDRLRRSRLTERCPVTATAANE